MAIHFIFLYQNGFTPLNRAVLKNNVEMAEVLVNAGAKTNIPNKVMICFILNKLQMYIIM